MVSETIRKEFKYLTRNRRYIFLAETAQNSRKRKEREIKGKEKERENFPPGPEQGPFRQAIAAS
jgi:hypothetical protein